MNYNSSRTILKEDNMAKKAKNKNLTKAKVEKNDEFYTK